MGAILQALRVFFIGSGGYVLNDVFTDKETKPVSSWPVIIAIALLSVLVYFAVWNRKTRIS
jgi:membrane protein DedA with SNARE-associated domain